MVYNYTNYHYENLDCKPNTFGKVKATKSQKIICMSKENKKTGPK